MRPYLLKSAKNYVSKDGGKNFIYLMQNLNEKDQERFFSFILQKWKLIENVCNFYKLFILKTIADDLRKNMEDAIIDDLIILLNSIVCNIKNKNSDYEFIHIDEFLYDDNDMNDFYLTFHVTLHFIFNTLLLTLERKMVLDIRQLDTLLYVYVYADAIEIINIKMNEEFYDIQYRIVNQYKINDN
ncbi:Ran-binding protein 3 [Vespula maculifrons]|uniref:Ran-binding protein 3 n=1 Tax=Vespula maculifrons TaxID=7453 RepID=A0ABD2CM06_VESMC